MCFVMLFCGAWCYVVLCDVFRGVVLWCVVLCCCVVWSCVVLCKVV